MQHITAILPLYVLKKGYVHGAAGRPLVKASITITHIASVRAHYTAQLMHRNNGGWRLTEEL